MLARLLSKPSHFRLLSNLSSKCQPYPLPSPSYPKLNTFLFRPFCSNDNDSKNYSDSKLWNLSEETDTKFDSSLFAQDSNFPAGKEEASWLEEKTGENNSGDIFGGHGAEFGAKAVTGDDQEWLTAEEYKPWVLEEEEKKDDLFDIGDKGGYGGDALSKSEDGALSDSEEIKRREEEEKILQKEEEELTAVLKGPNRAFGDLIVASGITDAMLDSLIALKDFEEVEGLPPLRDIEDMRYEKNTRKSVRAEIERQKQEEVAKARVRQVDDQGRAYGTGRRKCSIARVWIQPGDGKFLVNDKQFDVYFPMLDHRAALLRPFSETKTLGLWDINCTVKGGGVSGQVGAIQLGISRALQNWEPDMRPALKSIGFLTRDPRVVERKKPGKAKARKSFTWVKR